MKKQNNLSLKIRELKEEVLLDEEFEGMEAVKTIIFNHLRSDPAGELNNWPFNVTEFKDVVENIRNFCVENLTLVEYRDPFRSEFVKNNDGNSSLYAYVVVKYQGELYQMCANVDSWNQVWMEDGPHVTIHPVTSKTKTITVYE
ncbi:hypothetical protein E6Q11_01430 [Candidatus Dojkabacteria bacterium]|uniref:Uncharacterized protein n=1 Tax=Candidatus Dojkabacteria bacterium TaxID=2099670 RepID=A0A5C7JCN8_9BACT|nr:MAG: hypothetical protein E6Q11_01430 [Candidatus Dojkabacteria bacterium]